WGFGCNSPGPANENLMGAYDTGSYAVGFKSLFVHDTSRTVADSALRPVQIGFWYPRKPSEEHHKMTFRDYFMLSTQEKGPQKVNPDSVVENYKKLATQFGVSRDGIDSLFSVSFIARKDAPVAEEPFPLVMIGQGNMQTIFHQVVLCEYLASRGFYVLTTPSPTRITGFYKDYQGVVAKAWEQADDLAFARQKVLQTIGRDKISTGIVAYSFSARAALLYVMEHPDVKALVSLDGGIGNKMGKGWIDYVDDFEPGHIKVPILHIYQEGDEVVQPDFDLINSLGSSTKKFVEIDSVNHGFFMVMGAADGAIPSFMKEPYPGARNRYKRILNETGKFLDSHLK
ncbi:MAG: hypothetical protein PVH63_13080, partial [Balneolaceae bacterium]